MKFCKIIKNIYLGKIPGLDLAFYENGYVYHTRIDDIEHIKNGFFLDLINYFNELHIYIV